MMFLKLTPHLLLLFLLLVLPVSSDTNFVFSGNITCNFNRPFAYMIQVMEEDSITPDDLLSVDQLLTSYTSPVSYEIFASDSHDGPWDSYFEIYLLVNHDCRAQDDYNHMTLRVPVLNFWKMDGTHYHSINLDITGAGEKNDWDGPEMKKEKD